eukprot:1178528-Prorocentrum_minimum.AAC.1
MDLKCIYESDEEGGGEVGVEAGGDHKVPGEQRAYEQRQVEHHHPHALPHLVPTDIAYGPPQITYGPPSNHVRTPFKSLQNVLGISFVGLSAPRSSSKTKGSARFTRVLTAPRSSSKTEGSARFTR